MCIKTVGNCAYLHKRNSLVYGSALRKDPIFAILKLAFRAIDKIPAVALG
jgi:hypothetical protein